MPFETIVAIVLAYIALAVLLLSLNIFSRWRWWVKAGAMVICGVFFVVSYFAISSLLGWPDPDQPPGRFSVVATRVVEPNRAAGNEGAIYLWVETLDDDNIPSGIPLSYQLPYTDELARTVEGVQEAIDSGDSIEAALEEITPPTTQENAAGSLATGPENPAGSVNAEEYVPGVNLVFTDMPAVRLPSKGPL